MLLFLQISFASTEAKENTEGKSQNTPSEQQQVDSAKPNNETTEDFVGGVSGDQKVESDSVVDDSVSKYNFILYFLYKFKYEEEEEAI